MRTAGAGALGAGAVAALPGLAGSAFAAAEGMVDAGAGMHGELGTAALLSVATIGPKMVTCGVGTVGLDTAMVRQLLPLMDAAAPPLPIMKGTTGPFAMMMYSTSVDSYQVDRAEGMIEARGRMRSITRIADVVLEDVEHDYLAFGKDGRDQGADAFFLHYVTPFWTFPNNPMATPSDSVDGWSQFGGEIMVGAVNVGL